MNTFYRFALILGTFFISIASASAAELFSAPSEITPVHFSPITNAAVNFFNNEKAEIFSVLGISALSFLVTWETLGKKLQRTIAPKAPKDSPDTEVSKARKALGWTARFTLSTVGSVLVFFISVFIWDKIKKSLPKPNALLDS
jgi:hypothetical protein